MGGIFLLAVVGTGIASRVVTSRYRAVSPNHPELVIESGSPEEGEPTDQEDPEE